MDIIFTPTTYDRLNHYASMMRNHVERGKCIMCRDKNIFRPGYLLCEWGKYIVEQYNALLDKLWVNSYLDSEPEPLSIRGPWREDQWLGKLFGGWDLDGEWHRAPWIERTQRFLGRTKDAAKSFYHRNISNKELPSRAQHGQSSYGPSYRDV